MAEPASVKKNITLYQTYGYLQDGAWQIPLRLWVSEAPGKLRRLSARGSRKLLRKAIGIDKLTDAQEQRYLHRVHGFIADSKSGKKVSIRFNKDPQQESFMISGSEGQTKTDFS